MCYKPWHWLLQRSGRLSPGCSKRVPLGGCEISLPASLHFTSCHSVSLFREGVNDILKLSWTQGMGSKDFNPAFNFMPVVSIFLFHTIVQIERFFFFLWLRWWTHSWVFLFVFLFNLQDISHPCQQRAPSHDHCHTQCNTLCEKPGQMLTHCQVLPRSQSIVKVQGLYVCELDFRLLFVFLSDFGLWTGTWH